MRCRMTGEQPELSRYTKKGDKSRIQNYRPISILSSSCKILEHIIHKHISNFLEQHNVLTKFQHGFRRSHSTCTQLVETVHDFASAINDGLQTDVIFMDFKKAFDTVSHYKLLHKLDSILKNDKLVAWIAAYLSNRQQFVSFNCASSTCVRVDSGVPQGSVLGPLLFLIFINDIVSGLSVGVKLYADDCILYNKIECTEDQIRLNRDFEKVVEWCGQWQMSINFDKTVFMKITHKKTPLSHIYTTTGITLKEVWACGFLVISTGLSISTLSPRTPFVNYSF